MIRPVISDPVLLSLPASPAGKEDLPAARDLLDTLLANRERCAGMAANMIGVPKRIIAFFDGGAPVVMVNPKLLRRSKETYEAEEGCLSLPGTRKVLRAKWVELEWTPLRGKKRRGKFSGFTAEVIQHEMDHLEGILI